jgi:spermidine/putrescine transport system permease protein
MTTLRRDFLRWVSRHPSSPGALLLGPAGLWLLAFFLLPILILLAYSVMPRGAYGGVTPGFTLEHYRRFLDPLYLGILRRTVWLSFLCTVACLLLAYPTAWFIARSGRRRNLLLFLAVLPFWTSSLVRTYAMIFLLRDSGLVNRVLLDTGLIHAPLRLLYTEGAVLVGLVYGALPFMILPIYASLEKLDPALLEAAEILGARSWARFTRVIWPLTLPGVVAGSLLVFVPSLGSFVVPDLLGGARQMMIGNLIQNQFGPARNWPFGSAAAFAVMALVMVAMLGVLRVSDPHAAAPKDRA